MEKFRPLKTFSRKMGRVTIAKKATSRPTDDSPSLPDLAEIEKELDKDLTEAPSGTDVYGRYLLDLLKHSKPLLSAAQELRIARLLEEETHLAAEKMCKALSAAEACLSNPEAMANVWRARLLIKRLNPKSLNGDALTRHLIGLFRGPESDELFEQYAGASGKELRDHLITSNLRLVISLARKFGGDALPMEELVQEGNLGLMHAVLRYDYRHGFRFSTYACWWIRNAVTRGVMDKARQIRLPVHLIEFNSKVTKSRLRLTAELGRPPTDEEIAASIKTSARLPSLADGHGGHDGSASVLEKIRSLHAQIRSPCSLDIPLRNEDNDIETMHDILAAESHEAPPLSPLREGAVNERLNRAMKHLSPMELDVLRLRFGFESDAECSFVAIGEKYHLSRERMRQIQNRALAKLKDSSELEQLSHEVLD